MDVKWTIRDGGVVTVHKVMDGQQGSNVAMLTLRLRSRHELEWVDSAASMSDRGRFLKR